MPVLPRGNILHRNQHDPGCIWPSAITQTSITKLSVAAVSPGPILLHGQQEMVLQTTDLLCSSSLIVLLLISNSDGWDGNTPFHSFFCELFQDRALQVLVQVQLLGGTDPQNRHAQRCTDWRSIHRDGGPSQCRGWNHCQNVSLQTPLPVHLDVSSLCLLASLCSWEHTGAIV